MFKIATVQHTDIVTYLLDDYRGKYISGAFYEHESRGLACICCGESIAEERRRGLMVGIRCIPQFLGTQG